MHFAYLKWSQSEKIQKSEIFDKTAYLQGRNSKFEDVGLNLH